MLSGKFATQTEASQEEKMAKLGRRQKVKSGQFERKLLFILVCQKTFQLRTLHGLQFGLSQGRVDYWIHRLLPVLQKSLAARGMKPEHRGKKVAALIEASEGGANLSVDTSEREIQRPVNLKKQKTKYRGKKKTHTDKNVLLVNENTSKVIYLSATAEGKKPDKKLADESQISYPQNASLTKDTGFQGYEPEGVLSEQPKKRCAGKS